MASGSAGCCLPEQGFCQWVWPLMEMGVLNREVVDKFMGMRGGTVGTRLGSY